MTPVIAACALTVGIGVGGAAYWNASASTSFPSPASGSDATPVSATDDAVPPAQLTLPGTRFAWAPCQAPAVREGDACVTNVVQVVVRANSGNGAGAGAGGGAAQGQATAGTQYADDHEAESSDEGDEVEAEDSDHHEDSDDHDGEDDHDEDDD